MHPDQAADIALGLTRLCLEHGVTVSAPGQPQTVDTVLALYRRAFEGVVKVGDDVPDDGAEWLSDLEQRPGVTMGEDAPDNEPVAITILQQRRQSL